MIEQFKHNWRAFKQTAPGQRFQDRYQRRRRATHGRWTVSTVRNIVLGAGIVLGGVVLLPAPGPGWLIIFFGLSLLGGEFAPLARALDGVELKLRRIARWAKKRWQRSSPLVKTLLVMLGVLGLAGLGYEAHRLLTG